MIYVYHTYCMSFLTRKHFGVSNISRHTSNLYDAKNVVKSFEIFKWVYINNPLLSTYFREVCCISYSVHHLLSIRMNFGDMWPHSLPGDSVYGKARPVHEKRDPSVFLIFLTGRPAGVVRGSGWGGFIRRPRAVTVGTGALGPTVSADLGRWAAAGGAWSGHCSEVFRGGVSPCFSPDQLWLPSIHAQRHVAPRACILMYQNHSVLLKCKKIKCFEKDPEAEKWSAIPFL